MTTDLKPADLQATQELEAFGRMFGWLLDEWEVPPHCKDAFVELAKGMEPEQLPELIDLLYQKVMEQHAAESVPEYQAQARDIDAVTNAEMRALLAKLKSENL